MKLKKSILYWIIAWLGLFVAILYSPMANPDIAQLNSDYRVYAQNVAFDKAVFSNASRGSASSETGLADNLPESEEIRPSISNTGSYASGSSTKNTENSSNLTNSSSSHSVASASTATGETSGSYGVLSASRRSSSSDGGVGGISTLSTSDGSGATTRQAATSAGTSFTDPGNDPTEPPIPIGEDLSTLLVFVSIYMAIFFVKRRNRKAKEEMVG